MSSGLDWERFGVITAETKSAFYHPPLVSEKGVGIPTFVHFPKIKKTQRKSNTCEKHMIQVPKNNRFRKTRSRLGYICIY